MKDFAYSLFINMYINLFKKSTGLNLIIIQRRIEVIHADKHNELNALKKSPHLFSSIKVTTATKTIWKIAQHTLKLSSR